MMELYTFGRVRLNRDAAPGSSPQPKRLALLTYLLVATPRAPRRRDVLLALFWPELGEAEGRRALRQALTYLRRTVGDDLIRTSGDEVDVRPDGIRCDAVELEELLAAGRPADAAALYDGDFLEGFHVSEVSPEFEEWMQRTRLRLRSLAADASRQAGEAAEAAGLRSEAVRWTRRACELSLDDESAWRRLITALDRVGDRAGALRAYDDVVARLQTEFGIPPAAETVALAEGIRTRAEAFGYQRDDGSLTRAAGRAEVKTRAPTNTRRGAPRRAKVWLGGGAVVAAMGVFTAILVRGLDPDALAGARSKPAPMALAIAPLAIPASDTADAWLAVGVQQLLASTLAREAELDVVDPARVRDATDAARRARRAEGTPSAKSITLEAAASVGATLVADGSIVGGGELYVLDMAVREVPTGRTVSRFTARGRDVFDVVSEAAARLLAASNVATPGPRLEHIETRRIGAYRSYVEGLRLLADGRPVDATRMFDGAIASDSDFVSAVIARRRAVGLSAAARDTARRLDVAFARRSDLAPFDRMDLEAELAMTAGENGRAVTLARALVDRFPRDPRAHERLGSILQGHGRFAEAARSVERLVALDSQAQAAGVVPCETCNSHVWLAGLYMSVGDLERAESAARSAVRLYPDRPTAWGTLSSVLASRQRADSAISAAARAARLAPRVPAYALQVVRRMIEARRFDAAADTLDRWLRAAEGELTSGAIDLTALLLRERGRHFEAAKVIGDAMRRGVQGIDYTEVIRANSLARIGEVEEAMVLYARAAAPLAPNETPSVGRNATDARRFAWSKALAADALYLAGRIDTMQLNALADSVEVIGSRSNYGRDWRVHHHVRGLVATSAGRWADAERHFRSALWIPAGWTRTNIELARVLLAQRRTREAVQVLRETYMGPLDGMARHAPRSELDFWMSRAFAAAGQRDSARVYAAYARHAWGDAGPELQRRLGELPE
jgi:DNA-binding SARP family transcriptional activator/tetratricopeptide (TPR) repeat protein